MRTETTLKLTCGIPIKMYPACRPKQSRTKSTQLGKTAAYKTSLLLFVRKSFIASNTDLPRFYSLIKTHKTCPDNKIRPIVSNQKKMR